MSQKLRGPEATTEVEEIPNAGHQLYGDQPDLCNEAILRAAARLRGKVAVHVKHAEKEIYENN